MKRYRKRRKIRPLDKTYLYVSPFKESKILVYLIGQNKYRVVAASYETSLIGNTVSMDLSKANWPEWKKPSQEAVNSLTHWHPDYRYLKKAL